MDQKKLLKQMIDFQKATFDSSFNAMAALQEQGEKMVNTFVDQAPWLPAEGKKTIVDWVDTYKKGRESFKDAVERNFKDVESYFGDSAGKTE